MSRPESSFRPRTSLSERLRTVPERLPTELGKSPVIEALFEIRFDLQPGSLAQLPGAIFTKLGTKYGHSEVTPAASIPGQLRESDPAIRYQIHYRFRGAKYASVGIGEHVATVSVVRPYEGWRDFRSRIDEFLHIIQQTRCVEKIERFSLKYLNVLEAPENQQLNLVHCDLKLAGIKIPESGFRLRTEINDDSILRIVELLTNASLNVAGKKQSGLFISLDTIRNLKGDEDFWSNRAQGLEYLHQDIKELFFGIVTNETLESLGPLYE